MRQERPAPESWYRVPTMWLVVGVPLASVVLGVALLWLALRSDDGLVVDDYYRRGKEINLDLARDRSAARRGASASLWRSIAMRELRLDLQARSGRLPATLELQFWHATRAGHDRRMVLERGGDGHYRAPLPDLRPGRYHVQVAAEDWRLLGSFIAPGEERVELVATTY